MGKIYACVGRYAVTPYTIKKTCIRVYCVEELCYYICNNAVFVDEDFFDADLYSWLEEECNLPTLSKNLKQKARTDKRIESVVRFLLESVHYCQESEIDETENLLKANRIMPGKHKLKLRADYFLSCDRLSLAMQTYEDLLARLDEKKDTDLMAAVYHNIAVIYARMFIFTEAAEYFDRAYKLDNDEQHRICQLSAYRMMLSDDMYLKRVNSIGDAYESSVVLEDSLENTMNSLKTTDDYLRIKGLKQLKTDGNNEEYIAGMSQQLEYFKDDYRAKLKR